MCNRGHSLLPRLTVICADPIEVLAVAVARFIAGGYMTGNAECWDAAHDRAERALDPVDAARFVASIAAVMRALRREREEPWHFMPASCCRLTEDEQDLVKLLSSARAGSTVQLCGAATRLARQRSAPQLVFAAQAAGEMMAAASDRCSPSITGPAHVEKLN